METFTPRMKGVFLDRRPQEVSRARRAIRDSLCGYPKEVVGLVEQCASETVTNAVVHSEGGAVMVVIVELEDRVRIEVIDDGSERNSPRLREGVGVGEECGRGLFLVKALSDAWGAHMDDFGVNVWFEVGLG